jgi:hypothetical protein
MKPAHALTPRQSIPITDNLQRPILTQFPRDGKGARLVLIFDKRKVMWFNQWVKSSLQGIQDSREQCNLRRNMTRSDSTLEIL